MPRALAREPSATERDAPGPFLAAGVAAVAAWAPGILEAEQWRQWAVGQGALQPEGEPPQPSRVEAMLRRRLSPLARATLAVGERLLAAGESAQVVYASRHGDLRRTLELLDGIAADEPLSPTAFSLSVHNALPGLWAIARRDRSPALALAAGEESFAWGLVEAMARALSQPELPVLLLYADEPMPDAYADFDARFGAPIVVAVRFGHDAPRMLRAEWHDGGAEEAAEPAALAFLRAWFGAGGKGQWQGPGRAWEWSRHAPA